MSHSLRSMASVTGLAIALLSPAAAVTAVESHACARVVGAAARLACYDQAFPPPPEVHEETARRARQAFGMAPAQARAAAPDRVAAQAEPDRIEDRVAAVDYGSGGRRRISLENGQSWDVVDTTSSGPVRRGDQVLVRKGLLGAFLLTTPAGVSLRVRRTR